jgi:8-amino-7-oxononanoate synthase
MGLGETRRQQLAENALKRQLERATDAADAPDVPDS